jgi:hypothetical protein
MRLVAFLGLCCLCLFQGGELFGQNKKPDAQQKIDESFYTVLEQVLDINIAARVSETGEDAVWKVESSELTVPGKSVSVKLVGKNIVVLAQFTPYVSENNGVILVAQGQVWISSPMDDQIKYLTTLKNIPVNLGEKVIFFPLGVKNIQEKEKNVYNIELEIKILPYNRQTESSLK